MANKRIDQLTPSTDPILGTDLIPIWTTNGTPNTRHQTMDAITDYIDGRITGATFDDTFVTGATLNVDSLELDRNQGLSPITVDLSSLSPSGNYYGNVLFVSSTGDDSTAIKGNPLRPYVNIHIAKSASTSGDTIYVLPQTIVYDNRDTNGNPYTGQVDTLVNLWKDGVTYYFSPNTKIIFHNQTVTGTNMALFNPSGSSGETCTVLGHLEYEQFGYGADSSNGANFFYYDDDGSTLGSIFHAEVKKLTSHHNDLVLIVRYDVGQSIVTITSEEEYSDYLGGQSWTGGLYYIKSNGYPLEFRSDVKFRSYGINTAYPLYIRGDNSDASISFSGREVRCVRQFMLLKDLSGVIDINIDNVYYSNAYTPFGYQGSVMSTSGSGGWTLNMDSNLYDLSPNTYTTGIFVVGSTGNVLNFNGNITTNTNSGGGRFISSIAAGNVVNINGNISMLGTGVTSTYLFKGNGVCTTNYTGRITGNFATEVALPQNGGIINLDGVHIESTVDGATSSVFGNSGVNLGTGRLNNSYVRLTNNTNGVVDGEDNNIFINNSNIINLGSGSTVAYNTTDNGNLQIVNSTLISSYPGAKSIAYTGVTSVISSNTTVNTSYNIFDLKGTITTLTDLIY